MQNRKGSVLIISLWILAILIVFAIGVGHRASINLRLARYQRDRLKAYGLAKAAIFKAISLLKADAEDPETQGYDTRNLCGVNLKGKDPKDIFSREWNDSAEGFKIGYIDSSGEFVFGMDDEERKININGTEDSYKKKIIALLNAKSIGYAEEIASTIIDWMKPDTKIDIAKKELLKNPNELSVILEYFYQKNGESNYRDDAYETFNTIKDLITLYGNQKDKVNINTVNEEILAIFATSIADLQEVDRVPNVIGEIIKLRDEKIKINQPFKVSNDIKIEETGINLSDNLSVQLFNKLKNSFIFSSHYFKIEVIGSIGKITKNITIIYNREMQRIIFWHEN